MTRFVASAGLGLLLAVAAASPPSQRSTPSPAPDPEGDVAAAAATIADLAFLAGAWRADWDGSILEEHFTPPRDGTIVGMFRWGRDGATRLTEHMVIEQADDGVVLLLRHFNPGLVPWEQEADGPLRFRLEHVEGGQAVFEDLSRAFPSHIVYHRISPDTLLARLEGRGEDGEDRQIEFVYRSTTMTTVATESLTTVGQSLGYNGGLTISLPVKDIDKAIDFYQDVVGFKLQYKLDDMGWCELTTSVANVYIGISQVEKPNPGGQTPVFGVEDIEHARSALEGKGVKFDGETLDIPGMVKLATFFDLDGNPIKLFENLSDQVP